MKIISHAELLQCKPGTLIAYWEELEGMPGEIYTFSGEQGTGGDFVVAPLGVGYPHLPVEHSNWMDFWREHMLQNNGTALADFECYGRDGLYENDRKFVLLEKEDVVALFQHLAKSLLRAYLPESLSNFQHVHVSLEAQKLLPFLKDLGN